MNTKGLAVRVLGTTCGLLCDSCGLAELSRRDADDALEVMRELTLIRESSPRRDLGLGEVTVRLQELPRPLDAARDEVWCGGRPVAALNCRAKW